MWSIHQIVIYVIITSSILYKLYKKYINKLIFIEKNIYEKKQRLYIEKYIHKKNIYRKIYI